MNYGNGKGACSVCRRADVAEINAALANGNSMRTVEARYGVVHATLGRHMQHQRVQELRAQGGALGPTPFSTAQAEDFKDLLKAIEKHGKRLEVWWGEGKRKLDATWVVVDNQIHKWAMTKIKAGRLAARKEDMPLDQEEQDQLILATLKRDCTDDPRFRERVRAVLLEIDATLWQQEETSSK